MSDDYLRQPSGAYVNHGGIGFLGDSSGQVEIDQSAAQLPLRLVAGFDDKVIGECSAPANGWTQAALSEALNALRNEILSFAPVDAFLGDTWIGSTEL